MNIADIMTQKVHTCAPDDTLSTAAQRMWDADCGALPVVDASGKVLAMITDRDICMAAYTQGRALVDMRVASAASRNLVCAKPTDSIDAVEALMSKHRIRRIPVVDGAGKLVGLLSMNDLARHATLRGAKKTGITPENLVETLANVCQPRGTAPRATA